MGTGNKKMNIEQLNQIIGTFAKLQQAPETYKKGLANLIHQTGSHITDLTVGDLIKLAAAHTRAYQSKASPQSIAENCLIHGTGTPSEQLAMIASILGDLAEKHQIPRHALDNAVNIASIYLKNGYSGVTALMHGNRSLMDTLIPIQAA
jgi:hypothetical protein